MAIYHMNMKIVTRGKGMSAVAAAAYRSGMDLVNEWDGKKHVYHYKTDVLYTEIMLPENAPASFSDRSTLWNSLELYEKRGNAQLARSIEVSLPIELDFDEHLKMVHDYCEQFRSAGMVVDFAIHQKPNNPHCHILLTMRPIDENGKWSAKSRLVYDLDENGEKILLPSGNYKTHKENIVDWNEHSNAEIWRKSWADIANRYLEANGFEERIDHRSNEARGLQEIPTIHMGVAASAMEAKGIVTERGEINRQIRKTNGLLRDMMAKINSLKAWILSVADVMKELMEKESSPYLSDLLVKYLDYEAHRVQKYAPTYRVKHQSKVYNELMQNLDKLKAKGIVTLGDLEKAIAVLKDKNYTTTHRIKDSEKRMSELAQMIDHAECLMKYTPIKKELASINWKGKKEKFEHEHRTELALWDSANRFVHAKKIDTKTLKSSVKSWKAELSTLRAEKDREYEQLKLDRAEVDELNAVHRQIEKVFASAKQEPKKEQKKDMEL